MKNLAIFVSGSGTNCENIIHYFADRSDVGVRLVVSNRPDAFALVRAERLGVPIVVLSKADINNPATLLPYLKDIDYIILAGFLLMIPPYLTKAYDRRIINIHPALLPKYGGRGMYGHHVHEAVKAAGEKESGISIHYVSDVCDGGEIIFQASVPLEPTDTPDDIAAKIHELEQAHFPRIIDRVVSAYNGL